MDMKTKLLNCAEQLARKRGFDGFSYADIAKEIGIKKASIHYHFPTKSDLALALITRYRLNLTALLHALAQKDISAATKIKAYITIYREALSDGSTICLCISFSSAKESLSSEVIEELQLFRDDSITWLSYVFRQGLKDHSINDITNIKDEAYACLATVEGGHLIARSANDITQFDAACGHILSRLQ